ncbi:hypothetical protein QTP88_001194 [Uroleucon formosanum]
MTYYKNNVCLNERQLLQQRLTLASIHLDRGWFQRAPDAVADKREAYCKICRSVLRAHKTDLLRHANTITHKSRASNLIVEQQPPLVSFGFTAKSDTDKKRDLKLIMFIATHSDFRTIDHLGKCTMLIIHIITPAYLTELIEDVGQNAYSIKLDESTDITTHMYMAFFIRFYSYSQSDMPILQEVTQVNVIFQGTNIDVFKANCDLKKLLISLIRRVLKPNNISQIIKKNIEAVRNALGFPGAHLSNKCVDYDWQFETQSTLSIESKNINQLQLNTVKQRCTNFLLKLCHELCNRLPDSMSTIEKIESFCPDQCFNSNQRPSFGELPLNLAESSVDEDVLEMQWGQLGAITFNEIFPGMSISETSSNVEYIKRIVNCHRRIEVQRVSEFTIRTLTLPISNATTQTRRGTLNRVTGLMNPRVPVMLGPLLMGVSRGANHPTLECRWFNVILINGYAPTEDKEDEVKDIFYENLDNVCDRIPTNKVKILLGDFNAKIGQEVVYRPTIGKESLHRISNGNGTRLVNFAMTRSMILSSTTFPHKDIHKETWISPSGQIKNQIDHVIVDRRFKRCVMDVRSMRGSSAMSDHFIIRAKIKLHLSVEWRKNTISIKRFSIEDLKNQEINRHYKNKLKETLHLTESLNNVNNFWNEIENSIKTAATKVLRFEERKTGKKWFDEQCKKASNERDIARKKMLKDPTTIIKDEEGLLITDKTKAANEFKNMFETMLNQPTQVDVVKNLSTVEQRFDEPAIEEVERAVDMLKNGKAPGEDAIVAELLKGGGK